MRVRGTTYQGRVLDSSFASYGGRCRETFQAIRQRRVALSVRHPFDGEPDSFGGSYQDCQLLGTGESGIQQISTEQDIVLHEEREDHHRVFTALRFVYGDGPCQSEFGEICIIVGYCSLGIVNLIFSLDEFSPLQSISLGQSGIYERESREETPFSGIFPIIISTILIKLTIP